MKIGSLVECIADISFQLTLSSFSYWVNLSGPILGGIYVVRDIIESNCCNAKNPVTILLEEIVNPVMVCRNCGSKREISFDIAFFREIQPPIDIKDLVENFDYLTIAA